MKNQYKKSKIYSVFFIGGLLATECLFPLQATAAGFVDDSTLTGGFYYWQRQRDRKDTNPESTNYNEYVTNLSHTTTNLSLDFTSGYAWDFIGLDLGTFAAVQLAESDESGHPNEIAFSDSNHAYSEDYSGDKSGISLYKAAVKLQGGPFWARAGYIQPSGQTLLAPHWSFMPGTYRGFETGAKFDYDKSGALSFSYMWTDKYKSPWHIEVDDFYQNDRKEKVSYLHSLGAKYDFKNNLILEAAVGQSQNYVNQYFAKASYQFDVAGNPLTSSYQFYGAEDRISDSNDPNSIYDGLAWLQALTFGYQTGPVNWRLEGTMVQAKGNQGFFLQRMTPTYASSNGRLDVWWDNRSDFNANGEKSVYLGGMYDLSKVVIPGLSAGASYVYAWDAKPSTNIAYDQSQRVRESAWSLDAIYAFQEGKIKGTQIKLHYTQYDNHSSNPSWSNGYGNMFQDEKDVKFMIIAPFTIF